MWTHGWSFFVANMGISLLSPNIIQRRLWSVYNINFLRKKYRKIFFKPKTITVAYFSIWECISSALFLVVKQIQSAFPYYYETNILE